VRAYLSQKVNIYKLFNPLFPEIDPSTPLPSPADNNWRGEGVEMYKK
jgi:hypothetical protein